MNLELKKLAADFYVAKVQGFESSLIERIASDSNEFWTVSQTPGILSRCSTILADAQISVFAVSTFDTDYFLVRKEAGDSAIAAWRSGGINVELINKKSRPIRPENWKGPRFLEALPCIFESTFLTITNRSS